MKVLIIHPSFASQYTHIVKGLCEDPKNQVVFLCRNAGEKAAYPNLKLKVYKINKDKKEEEEEGLNILSDVNRHTNEGVVVGEVLLDLRNREKFIPDIILTHPGWGSVFFIRDIYPHVPMISYIEYYESSTESNAAFDPLQEMKRENMYFTRMYNTVYLHAITSSEWLICPTQWQSSRVPEEFQYKLSTLHDGIDTEAIKPRHNLKIKLSSGLKFTSDDEIVTYVARGFETMRGFPTVMAALPMILKERPKAHILMIGSEKEAYGGAPTVAQSWKRLMSKAVDYDKSRVHWLGRLDFETYTKILNISSAHIYLTKPFVLSWSLTEAMAAGCNIVSSATKPVMELIQDGHNGLLVDFFSAEHLAQAVCRILGNKEEMKYLGENARKTIEEKIALKKVLPLHLELIKQVAEGKIPPPAHKKMAKIMPRIDRFYKFPTYVDV